MKNVVEEEHKARMEIEERRHAVSKVSTSPLKRKVFTKKEVEIISEFFVKHIRTCKLPSTDEWIVSQKTYTTSAGTLWVGNVTFLESI